MRVDAVPLWLKPIFHAWAESVGGLFYVKLKSVRHSMTIELQGHVPSSDQPAIFAIWHENLVPLFISLEQIGHRHIWMNHPLWYMKPVHVLLRHLGINELALGSTGHNGQAALEILASRMKATRASSMMAVDGPAGPPYQLRKGCLYLALKTQFPVIPVRFKVSDFHRLEFTWDRKIWPKYGSDLTATFAPPIFVKSQDDIAETAEQLVASLNQA